MGGKVGIDAMVIGASWGGLGAVTSILSRVPWRVGAAIVLCQHQYPHAISTLPQVMRGRTKLKVMEVEDKLPLESGVLYVCPPNYHTMIERDRTFALSIDPPVMYCRPAIDVLFASAAEAYGERLAGVILTGANEDGAAGLYHVARCGGMPIVQDPKTAEVPVMPEAALKTVPWAHVMTLGEIGEFMASLAAA
ncbi:MAG: chemotaxis protein CheB [Pseudomonadota bacterium]